MIIYWLYIWKNGNAVLFDVWVMKHLHFFIDPLDFTYSAMRPQHWTIATWHLTRLRMSCCQVQGETTRAAEQFKRLVNQLVHLYISLPCSARWAASCHHAASHSILMLHEASTWHLPWRASRLLQINAEEPPSPLTWKDDYCRLVNCHHLSSLVEQI